MSKPFPTTPAEIIHWQWADYEPFATELAERSLTKAGLKPWLADWTLLASWVEEQYTRLSIAMSVNTVDEEAHKRFENFMDTIFPKVMEVDQKMKEKLLASGLEPEGFEIPLRNLRAEADLFRQENLSLLGTEAKYGTEYDKIAGAQVVTWEGEERTISSMQQVGQDPDRARREQAWRLVAERQLADRPAFNELWGRFLSLRLKIAANAGKPDYRAYRWQNFLRFDYTPSDCRRFHAAIEETAVPASVRIYERRRQALGLDTLRPWDLAVDISGQPPLRPYQTLDEFKQKISAIFHHVDPVLGGYFDSLNREGLLDIENRKNKAPGAFCASLPASRRPFVFENAVGLHSDVQTLLHESGHAFHVFESLDLPYIQQMGTPMEFAEVASMGMELLASPYLATDFGGFYTPAQAARARIEHLEKCITFWPYMAVVDAFQHWVYENPEKALVPANCDACWADLWERFMQGVDWSGLDDIMLTGWHRKLHIFQVPFYYIEYGLAQLGAAQVWANALKDQAGAVRSYRKALSLGYTASLPELYRTAGARLAFDAETLGQSVKLMESTINDLRTKIQ